MCIIWNHQKILSFDEMKSHFFLELFQFCSVRDFGVCPPFLGCSLFLALEWGGQGLICGLSWTPSFVYFKWDIWQIQYRKRCRICHYLTWTDSIKPSLLFSNFGWDVTRSKFYKVHPKVNQVIYTSSPVSVLNIKALSLIVFELSW